MQENTNPTKDTPSPDGATDAPSGTTHPLVQVSQPVQGANTPTNPMVTPAQVVPSAGIYPEATKGFVGALQTSSAEDPLQSLSEDSNSGQSLLFVSAFAVSFALVLSIVASVSGVLEIIFNHLGKTATSSTSSYLGLDTYELKLLLWLVSSLVISTVVYVLMVLYLQKNNEVRLTDFSLKVKGFVYGAFLSILAVATVTSVANIAYSALVPLVPKGSYETSTGAWWPGIVQAVLTSLLLAGIAFYYVKKAKRL